MDAVLYWGRVLRVAFFSTAEILGWGHPLRWPLSALFTLLAAALFYWVTDDPKVPTDKVIWLVFLLAGAGTVFAAVFAFSILTTPPKMASDANAASAKVISDLEGKLAGVAAKVQSQTNRQAVAAMIAGAIQAGSVLCNQKVASDSEFSKLRSDVDTWYRTTSEQIRGTLSVAEEVAFQHVGQIMAADVIGSFNSHHSTLRLKIQALLKNLRELHARHASQGQF
jgi:hypothetical protein